MIKKFTLTLLAALAALGMSATDYYGTMTTTAESGSLTRNNVLATVTKTGADVYDVTLHNVTFSLMGEAQNPITLTFYSMIGTTDDDGYTTVSGNAQVRLNDFVDFSDLDDLLGMFGGFGDVSSLITNQSYPVTFSGKFNYRYLTGQLSTTVNISVMGMYELLNEKNTVTYSGESNEEPPVVYERGDVNGDGTVDVEDVNTIINIILGNDTPDNYGGRADLTEGDGNVDVADMNIVISILLGA